MILKNRFGEYIANLRKEKGISLEQLSDGLCAVSLLSRVERGEREPEKLLQNRFLTRLGVVPENYENFLYYDDYCRWEKRQGILHHILEENIEEAKALLEAYRKEYKMHEALEQQFYLAMLAQIRRYEGAENAELMALFEQALELTVPEINYRSFRNRVLSLEELNLLLEYRYCNSQNVSLKFYDNLLEYIEKMEQTILAKAKIYPKAVYYYYKAWKENKSVEDGAVERLLELCDSAIETLRDANRMFYLWELFCMREDLVQRLPDKEKEDEAMQKRCQECHGWKETLEELYQEYGITLEMYEYCYLYVESENYCIGDVIRIRRKMLGLSQEKLCQGICESRTVSRLERHMRKPQKEIVQQLFERLNLSTELCRTELVTDNPEAIEKYRELRKLNNVKDYVKVAEILKELKGLISTEIPSNRQALLRKEVMSLFDYGLISREEYINKMKDALECTIPYKKVIGIEEKYLTNEEIYCIQNMTLELDWSRIEMKECVEALIGYCEKIMFPASYVRVYQFIMATAANYLGNILAYEKSNLIEKKMLHLLLVNKRMGGIHESLYEMIWNHQSEQSWDDEYVDWKFEQCIQSCLLSNDYSRIGVYINKRDTLNKKENLSCDNY